jgi:hypothetical protein
MTWENSIFNDDRSAGDRFQNRDSDTHMEIDQSDLMSPRELAGWEEELIEDDIKKVYSTSEALEHEPDLEQ